MLVQWKGHLEHRKTDDANKTYRPPEPRQLVDDLRDQLQTAIEEERFEEAGAATRSNPSGFPGTFGLNQSGL